MCHLLLLRVCPPTHGDETHDYLVRVDEILEIDAALYRVMTKV